jgi:hypothetical protein
MTVGILRGGIMPRLWRARSSGVHPVSARTHYCTNDSAIRVPGLLNMTDTGTPSPGDTTYRFLVRGSSQRQRRDVLVGCSSAYPRSPLLGQMRYDLARDYDRGRCLAAQHALVVHEPSVYDPDATSGLEMADDRAEKRYVRSLGPHPTGNIGITELLAVEIIASA